jgi:hypothetical protein
MHGDTCDGPDDSLNHPGQEARLWHNRESSSDRWNLYYAFRPLTVARCLSETSNHLTYVPRVFHRPEPATNGAGGDGGSIAASGAGLVGNPSAPSKPSRSTPCGAQAEGVAVLDLINTSQCEKRPSLPYNQTPRRYTLKAVKSGRHVEVFQYHTARTNIVAKKGGTSGSDKPKGERLRMDNIYRAKSQCKRTINANASRGRFEDKFVTLTYAEEVEDLDRARSDYVRFIKRLGYRLNINVRYVAVPQIQRERELKTGKKVIHYHVYFFGLPFVAKEDLAAIWGQGFVRINAIDNVENVGSYVTNYMEKDFTDEEFIGRRRYYCSRGLVKPEEMKAESIAKIMDRMGICEEFKTFELTYINNPYVGAVTYAHYLLPERDNKDSGGLS